MLDIPRRECGTHNVQLSPLCAQILDHDSSVRVLRRDLREAPYIRLHLYERVTNDLNGGLEIPYGRDRLRLYAPQFEGFQESDTVTALDPPEGVTLEERGCHGWIGKRELVAARQNAQGNAPL